MLKIYRPCPFRSFSSFHQSKRFVYDVSAQEKDKTDVRPAAETVDINVDQIREAANNPEALAAGFEKAMAEGKARASSAGAESIKVGREHIASLRGIDAEAKAKALAQFDEKFGTARAKSHDAEQAKLQNLNAQELKARLTKQLTKEVTDEYDEKNRTKSNEIVANNSSIRDKTDEITAEEKFTKDCDKAVDAKSREVDNATKDITSAENGVTQAQLKARDVAKGFGIDFDVQDVIQAAPWTDDALIVRLKMGAKKEVNGKDELATEHYAAEVAPKRLSQLRAALNSVRNAITTLREATDKKRQAEIDLKSAQDKKATSEAYLKNLIAQRKMLEKKREELREGLDGLKHEREQKLEAINNGTYETHYDSGTGEDIKGTVNEISQFEAAHILSKDQLQKNDALAAEVAAAVEGATRASAVLVFAKWEQNTYRDCGDLNRRIAEQAEKFKPNRESAQKALEKTKRELGIANTPDNETSIKAALKTLVTARDVAMVMPDIKKANQNNPKITSIQLKELATQAVIDRSYETYKADVDAISAVDEEVKADPQRIQLLAELSAKMALKDRIAIARERLSSGSTPTYSAGGAVAAG